MRLLEEKEVKPELQWDEQRSTKLAAPFLRGTYQEMSTDASCVTSTRKRFLNWTSSADTTRVQKRAHFCLMPLFFILLTLCCFPQAPVWWHGLHGGITNLRNPEIFVTTNLRLQFSVTCASLAVCGAVLSTGSGKQSKLKITQWCGWEWQEL